MKMIPKAVLLFFCAATTMSVQVQAFKFVSDDEVFGGHENPSNTTANSTSWIQTDRDDHMRNAFLTPQPRIAGGSQVTDRSLYPWFVSSAGSLVCGGSLVSRDFVLTAAHCSTAFGPGQGVWIGRTSKIGLDPRFPDGVVARRHRHPEYDSNMIYKDFMLVRLERPVRNVQPITLNRDEFYPRPRRRVTVMGFGRTSETGPLSWTLRDVDLQIVDHSTCAYNYRMVAAIDQVTPLKIERDAMICASAASPGRAACLGDSGSPLIRDGIQVGLVSFGVGCGNPSFPGVYARVSSVYDWVYDTICRFSNYPPSYCGNGGGGGGGTGQDPVRVNLRGEDSEQVSLRLRFAYDMFPAQTTWRFETDRLVNAVGPMSTPNPGAIHDTTFSGVVPGNYTFIIEDTEGDGIDFTFRIFEIWLSKGTNETEELLVAGEEQFFWEYAVNFAVPAV